jgi:3-hydroxyisobutyrate dehydrogenase-like beta-hydroxyacid dehydrogenase
MSKDTRYMLDLAVAADLETPAIAAVSRRMHELTNSGLGDLDYSAVAKPYLQEHE